jgi:hypothetical protein
MAPRVLKIGKGVKVVTKKKPVRYGTVVDVVGPKQWTVEFGAEDEDGGVKTEQLSSAQLGVYKEYYNKQSNTPVRSALKTIRKAVRETVGRPRRARRSPSSVSSASSSSCISDQTNQRDDDEDFVLDVNNEGSPSDNESPLLTPTPPTPTGSPVVLPRQRQLFVSSPNGEVEVVVEDVLSDDESAGSFDDFEEEEEDPDGTDQLRVTMPTEDGGEEVEFLDRPMKKAAYENSFRIMKEDKKRLIDEEYEIVKTVKTTNKYAVGGKVVGAKNTIHADLTGTIAEVVDGDGGRYRIEWDDDSVLNCIVEKKYLRLRKETGQTYTWKVVGDHIAPNPPTKYDQCGVIDFSMKDFSKQPGDPDYNHPFARLVEALWPGEWREQLAKMNEALRQDPSLGKECTEDEWWTFWGILILAAKLEKGGVDALFDKGKKKLLDELPSIDLSDRMKKYRFEQLKRVIPTAFHGDDKGDLWNPIKSLIDGFNNKRARKIAASFCKVHDESMSAFKPRTTKTGGLPFLSFILRKPKPIGTEFKVTACTETGKCIVFNLVIVNRSTKCKLI